MQSNLWKYYVFSFFSVRLFASVITPFYLDVARLSYSQIQLLQSALSLGMLCFELPTGVIADRIGRKQTLLFGVLCDILAIVLMLLSQSWGMLIVSQVIFALGFSLVSGADDALVYDTLVDSGQTNQATHVFGRARAVHLAGMFVFALVGSWLAARYGLLWPVALSILPYLVSGGVAATLREPTRHYTVSKHPKSDVGVWHGIGVLRRHHAVQRLVLDGLFVYLAAWFGYWIYPIMLRQFAVPLVYFGVFQAVSLAAEILVVSNFTWFVNVLGSPKHFLTLSAWLTAISFFVLAAWPNLVTVTLFIILAGGFGQARYELVRVYLNHHIRSQERAVVLSTISLVRRLCLLIVAPGIGGLMDQHLPSALLLLGVVALASLGIKSTYGK